MKKEIMKKGLELLLGIVLFCSIVFINVYFDNTNDAEKKVEPSEFSVLNVEFDDAVKSFNRCDSVFKEANKLDDLSKMIQWNDSCHYYRDLMVSKNDEMLKLKTK